MKKIIFSSVIMMFCGGAAQAEGLVFDPSHSLECANRVFASPTPNLSRANACITLSSERCVMDTQGGNSTAGMAGCADRGHQMWDAELNRIYHILREQEARATEQNRRISDRIPSSEEALVDMQRAWITYRDARCSYAYSQFGGGTGGGPALTGCLETMTGEQALYLRAHLWE